MLKNVLHILMYSIINVMYVVHIVRMAKSTIYLLVQIRYLQIIEISEGITTSTLPTRLNKIA